MKTTNKITFENIAGYKEEKKELLEICNLIANREKLMAAGGKMPKGLLLIGPSGVGKTLFAKALLNGCKCPNVEINYNDTSTQEEFTGYVKEKFEQAINQLPCVLYIDQIDKMIGQFSPFGNNDNFDKGNIILNELNKYSDVEGLFILLVSGKTCRFDSSIVRSGRVDRVINIDYPSEKEREDIIAYYCKNKKLAPDVNFAKISKIFKGFTGADIESVLNNCVIKAFSRGSNEVTFKDVNDAYYDMLFKNSIKDVNISEDELECLAYHEAGHALVGLLSDPDSVTYASIKPRGNFMGFVNRHLAECKSTTLEDKRNEICIALAGRAAEQTQLYKLTDGCSTDLAKAKFLISDIVRRHGMLGLKYLDIDQDDALPFGISSNPSSSRNAEIDRAEVDLLEDLYTLSINLIFKYSDVFKEIVDQLKENKNLTKSDLEKIVDDFKLKELNLQDYRVIRQRVGVLNFVDEYELQKRFDLGFYQARLVLHRLQKDKLVSTSFGAKGYKVQCD